MRTARLTNCWASMASRTRRSTWRELAEPLPTQAPARCQWERELMYQHGWFQIAFDRELTREVSPSSIGQLRLVLVRVGSEITAFDAICPHRGADLGIGGRHDRGALVCPFHGFRIGLGQDSEH